MIVDGFEIAVADQGIDTAMTQEIEILAVGIPGGIEIVGHIARDRMSNILLGVVDEHRAIADHVVGGVGQPATIGAPHVLVDFPTLTVGDFHRLGTLGLKINEEQAVCDVTVG